MKKLVYLFAIMMGMSLVSCDWFTNKTPEATGENTEAVEATAAEGGDSLNVGNDGDSVKNEVTAEQAQEAPAEEAK